MDTNTFPVSDKTAKQIEKVFTYHKPANDEVAARCQEVRDKFKEVASFVASKVQDCRELSMALTDLEHASMASIAGIVRNQVVPEVAPAPAPSAPEASAT